MSKYLEVEALVADIGAVEQLLNTAHNVNDRIGIIQYKSRLEELRSELAAVREAVHHHANVELHFGGKPVLGSRGIAAEFAGKTLKMFQELVAKSFAQAKLGRLGERGRVPLAANTKLIITDVTRGSFGFVLTEESDQGEVYDTALKEVIGSVLDQMECSAGSDEEAFERAVEHIDGRVLLTFREFFKNLDSNDATLRVIEDTREVSLDAQEIQRARRRLDNTKSDDEEQDVGGVLIGFLPGHCTFELRREDGAIIYGSATKKAAEQFTRCSKERQFIEQPCIARIRIRRVTSPNRPLRLTHRILAFMKFGADRV